jgi:hypothetical protein
MKNDKYLGIAILASTIVLQRIALQFFRESSYIFPFCSGLQVQANTVRFFAELSYMILPLPFILFLFWDKASDLTQGYGKLILIRNYKRSKLCLRGLLNSAIWLFGIALFQMLVFIIPDKNWKILEINTSLLMLFLYYLTMLAVVSLQYCLEFYFGSQPAFGAVCIYFIVSIFVGNILFKMDKFGIVEGLFFPNMAFAPRNGLVSDALVSMDPARAIGILFMIIIATTALSVYKFSRKDIF